MATHPDKALLKKLLDRADELGRIRHAQRDVSLPATRHADLDRRATRIVTEVGGLLKEIEGDGALRLLLRRYHFTRHHVLVMLELLRRRLSSPDVYLNGRDLLGLLFHSSFEILDGLGLLAPRSPLLTSGILVPHLLGSDDAAELLEMRYRLGDRAFRMFMKILRGKDESLEAPLDLKVRPYRNNLAYLMDLRRLALLYQKRAAKVFRFDEWDELGADLPESLPLLNKKIPQYSRYVRECLEQTPSAENFAAVLLTHEFKLLEEHWVILVTLVFQELSHGNPYLDAVDLLKLIGRNEQDLVRKRKIFSRRSPLVSSGLVILEEIVHNKDLSAEVYVPNEMVDRILGDTRDKKGRLEIDSESRRDFHRFLNELDSSEDFFKRL